jgi:hypothetical protein
MVVGVEVVYKGATLWFGEEAGLTGTRDRQDRRAFIGNEDWSWSNYGIYDVSCMNCISIWDCCEHVCSCATSHALSSLTCEG